MVDSLTIAASVENTRCAAYVAAEMGRPLPLQPEEEDVLVPRDRLTVSQWAEERRQLSKKTTDWDGPWSNERTPYLVQIMDWLSEPGCRQVTLMKCSQGGGTEVGLNFMGWTPDECPGPFLMVMPREDDVTRRVETRIKTMFEATPSLMRHIGGNLDRINIGKQSELDNMLLYLAWSTSPAALADNPCCYVWLDEVGKFDPKSKRESDAVTLGTDRVRTFYSRSKILITSSPVDAGDLMDREFSKGDQCVYWSKCPHCGRSFVIRWHHYDLDKTPDGKLLTENEYLEGGRARIVCEHCGSTWSEQERWQAVCDGRWLPGTQSIDEAGNVVGVAPITSHHSARMPSFILHPHFMDTDRLAAKFSDAQLHAKGGDVEPLKNFIRNQCAECWEEVQKSSEADDLQSHCGPTPMGLIPVGAAMLTAALDVQIDHVWLLVVAWGYLSEAWIVWYQRIETGDTEDLRNWTPVRTALAARHRLAAEPGQAWAAQAAAIDTGYRPDVAKDFLMQCRELPLLAVRGEDSVRTLYRKAVEGPRHRGLERYDLNTNAYKDRIGRLMWNPTPGPGYLHLPADAADGPHSYLRDHLTAEKQKIVTGPRGQVTHQWDLKRPGIDNHLLDCLVYAMFAADLCGARLIRDPQSGPPPQRRAAVMERMK